MYTHTLHAVITMDTNVLTPEMKTEVTIFSIIVGLSILVVCVVPCVLFALLSKYFQSQSLRRRVSSCPVYSSLVICCKIQCTVIDIFSHYVYMCANIIYIHVHILDICVIVVKLFVKSTCFPLCSLVHCGLCCQLA